jgi:CheY-like chemotaxis protein
LGGDVTVESQVNRGSTFTLKIDAGPSAGVERLSGLTEATLPLKTEPRTGSEIYLRGRILLVEDGADNQRLLRMQLGSAGASVVSAMNGQMAVDMAAAQPFDLILMDMQMPVMDGYNATIELRRRGLTIPIIAMTAYAMSEDREKCMAIGCTDYLSKPVAEVTLLTTVNGYLGKPLPQEARTVPPGLYRVKSSLADDPRMTEMISEYVQRLPGKVHKMLDKLEQHDLIGLLNLVHDLVGTAGGYGFGILAEPARKAQQAIREGAPLEPITAEINVLVDIIRHVDGYDESEPRV